MLWDYNIHNYLSDQWFLWVLEWVMWWFGIVVEILYVKVCVKLTLGMIQLLYLDGKLLLDFELVLSVLSVTPICHGMLKWK